MRPGWIAASLAAATLCHALPASAFSDAALFAEPTIAGGGGGRWFTGSPADGYGCDTCHTGQEGVQGPDVTVTGLPLNGYVPGATYDVQVRWPAWVVHSGTVAELTDEYRLGAGTVLPPELETVGEDERCRDEQGVLGPLGLALHEADNGRQLVSSSDCGARVLRFRWVAPSPPVGTVWFSAGLVQSNTQQDDSGDSATMMLQPLSPAGSAPYRAAIASGCAIAHPTAARAPASVLGLAVWVLVRRRRVRRQSKESLR